MYEATGLTASTAGVTITLMGTVALAAAAVIASKKKKDE
ncbi:MAG: LPXTG cell wall anchor domain-containing protein [Ruminococcus sp.]|nr:LPXTG cell wall anchor domain-containing protein [Ruminococcus sp.]